ncbi:winged helix-turn-helix domain-containing protein [Halosegnis marinus]|uniref:Winged helix-turn-helix domain-containing protein n=1 Tax=Halosegnis marinus TaxID=3034023 RepID=A0ABD5ZR39_9EURY|nr:winged helix-turn-helix domain-containing protein [Halosegnis sp. DT85]
MSTNRLRPADRQLLAYLDDNPPEYVPLMATRLGLPLGHANDRVAALVERGYVRPVTNECIYRLTDDGRERLADAAADREPGLADD